MMREGGNNVFIKRLRIQNFRSIKSLDLELGETTVFVGANNTGKSAILEAIRIALTRRWGQRGTGFIEYDVHIPGAAFDPKTSAPVLIEIELQEAATDRWPQDLRDDLADIIQLDPLTGLGSIILRVSCGWNADIGSYEPRWEFLNAARQPLVGQSARATNLQDFFEYLPVFYLDALRDADDEFTSRSQFWGRLLRSVTIPPQLEKRFQRVFDLVNQRFVAADPRLGVIASALSDISAVASADQPGNADLRMMPLRPWDLLERAEVIYRNDAARPWLPLARHGQGVQSLSVVFLFKAFVEQLLAEVYRPDSQPVLALEEPETHLHPQAARTLWEHVRSLPGQKLVTTHSPYFLQYVPFRDLRIVRDGVGGTTVVGLPRAYRANLPHVTNLDPVVTGSAGRLTYDRSTTTMWVNGKLEQEDFRELLKVFHNHQQQAEIFLELRRVFEESKKYVSDEELQKLETFVRRMRGEVFFAHRWLLVEGQTEHHLVHAIGVALDYNLDAHGVAVIDVQNNGSARGFVALARALAIPWLAVFDDDEGGQASMQQIEALGIGDAERTARFAASSRNDRTTARCRRTAAGTQSDPACPRVCAGSVADGRCARKAVGGLQSQLCVRAVTSRRYRPSSRTADAGVLAKGRDVNEGPNVSDTTLDEVVAGLTEPQRAAASWGEGPLLVVAGPGSGKTRVLIARIAKILHESPSKKFRILALTFTNKAADEMSARLRVLAPGEDKRARIGTFHSFSMQMLQQHGAHIGVRSDFAIYATNDDRREVVRDAMRQQGVSGDVGRYLAAIDRLKARLLSPDGCGMRFRNPADGARVETVYRAYEAELERLNALDYPSLIQRSYDLITRYPRIAEQYQNTYRYWLIDEFQDTTDGQYRLIKQLSGSAFKNIFAVADDDQLIFEWNGASSKQLDRFCAEFKASQIQLPTNYRCPSSIVVAANRLVLHNKQRASGKLPLEAARTTTRFPPEQHIRVTRFDADDEEFSGIAADIQSLGREHWSSVAVIARTNAVLERMRTALVSAGVPAAIAQRRDEFRSDYFRWLVAILNQVVRPLDRRNLKRLVSSFNAMCNVDISSESILAEAEVSSRGYLEEWRLAVTASDNASAEAFSSLASMTSNSSASYRDFIRQALELFPSSEELVDVTEDRAAWSLLDRTITQAIGRDCSLDQFLQELAMRSKEPPIGPQTVTLLTIHAAKGKEFDFVYVVGLAEEILPSFQSIEAGDASSAMEEERRNCFVAITRTRERLVLSYADRYRGRPKAPSRFLREMGCLSVPPG